LGKGFLIWISKYISISSILIEYLRYLRWVVAIFTIFSVASILYYISPNVKIRYLDIIPGAAFATVGWIAISTIISVYFNNVRGYSTIYGSIGAIIILMIWLFWGSIIIILGGELNAVVSEMRLFKDKENVVRLNKRA
jgi:membrane protein